MSDNYAVINGKRIELTDEQVKALGIKVRKNPFERVANDEAYYYVKATGYVSSYTNANDCVDRMMYDAINYFNDEDFAKQVALHQLLYRKLLKFAYDNGFEDTAEWDGENCHWLIEYVCTTKDFIVRPHYDCKSQGVYFSSDEAAKRAGNEVIMPFMKEHPEFVW